MKFIIDKNPLIVETVKNILKPEYYEINLC